MKWLAPATLYLVISSAAYADVEICNRTSHKLQLAIAYPITDPYPTREISGWHKVSGKRCITPLMGKAPDTFEFYYFIAFMDGKAYQPAGEDTVYDFCVTKKTFSRRGSWKTLQTECPPNYSLRSFYRERVPPEGLTLEIN